MRGAEYKEGEVVKARQRLRRWGSWRRSMSNGMATSGWASGCRGAERDFAFATAPMRAVQRRYRRPPVRRALLLRALPRRRQPPAREGALGELAEPAEWFWSGWWGLSICQRKRTEAHGLGPQPTSELRGPREGGRREELLTASEVAPRLLDVPESWVRRETRAGRFPHVEVGRYRRYRPDEAVETWIRDRERGPIPLPDMGTGFGTRRF